MASRPLRLQVKLERGNARLNGCLEAAGLRVAILFRYVELFES